METSGKFINFLLIITVVIVTQGTTYGQGPSCCRSDKTQNITECCLCDLLNCSALDLKTFYPNKTVKCILSTTSTESTSSVGTTLSETSTTYIAPPTGEDEGRVTLCVSACPGGSYEDQNQTCKRCDELCKNCTLDTCLECKYGKNSSVDCCREGTRLRESGNITICEVIPKSTSQKNDKIYIIIGCVVGGLVVIGLLVVVVVCLCCRRQENGQPGQKRPISRLLELRKRKNYDYPDFQLPSANELKSVEESIVSGGRRPGAYENTATLDHRDLARRAQQEQDKIGRYAKDPTGKKKKGNQSNANDDEEPQETYENQPTIDLHNKQSVHKKKKGPFNKLSQKFRSKKGHKQDAKTRRKTEPPAATEPLEEYEDVNSPSPQADLPTETYEDVGSGHPDFPQENYEGVDRFVNLNDDMPVEEYTAMDPSTIQPQEVIQPKKKSKKPKKTRGISQKGAENPTFSGENPYANYTPGAQQTQQSESDYQNYQNLAVGPEEEYVNY